MYRSLRVAVVIPAFNEQRLLRRTLASIPEIVDTIIVIDDASTDETAAVLRSWGDPRLLVVLHVENQGVGAAIITGYRAALSLPVDIAVVMAADAQMDPEDLPGLIDPVIDEGADYVKGNRLVFPQARQVMPPVRYFGTFTLSWITRLSSGYPDLMDTQCGYTVIRCETLRALDLDSIYPRYGFPNDILNQLGAIGAALGERPVRPVYMDERSDLKIPRVIRPISRLLARGIWRRWGWRGWGWEGENIRRTGVGFLVFLIGVLGGWGWPIEDVGARPARPSPKLLSRISNAVEVIERRHLNPPDVEKMLIAGIRGALDPLDHHARYFDPETYRRWRAQIYGQKVGPGIAVVEDDGHWVVSFVSPNSPAEKAGIKLGDELLSVGGKDISKDTVLAIKALLEGRVGTQITLRWRSSEGIEEVSLRRAQVKSTAVTATLLQDGIGHIRISRYQRGTSADLLLACQRLEVEQGVPLNGLIIDLRGNLGGLLNEGIEMANLFLPAGKLIVSLEGRAGTFQREHRATGPVVLRQPLIVLIDGLSASASELFAAALQDHHRALLMGTLSYGKGSVQSTYSLVDGGGLKITTSLYFTPDHRKIDDAGVVPDVSLHPSLKSTAIFTPPRTLEVVHTPAAPDDLPLQSALGVLRAAALLNAEISNLSSLSKEVDVLKRVSQLSIPLRRFVFIASSLPTSKVLLTTGEPFSVILESPLK